METSPTTVQEARHRIDEINKRVVELLAERQAIVEELCELKADAGRPVRDPEREAELLDHVRDVAEEAGLPPDLAERLFEKILVHSVRRQRRQRGEDDGDAPAACTMVDPESRNGAASPNGAATSRAE